MAMVRRDPNCMRCGLCDTTEFVCLLGKGPKRSKVMMVGEAPGERENEKRKVFVGKAGQFLHRVADEVNLDLDKIYITNAVHCRPPENRTPKKSEIDACKFWLQGEIDQVKPKYICLFGNVAMQSVLRLKGIKKYRGKAIEKDGIVYFPMYHPSYPLRDPRQEATFRADLRTFKEIVQYKGVPKEKKLKYVLCETQSDLNKLIAWIKGHIAIDCETTGLNPWAKDAKINTISFGNLDKQWVVPISHKESPFTANTIKRFLKKIARVIKRRCKITNHNWKFDHLWIRVLFGIALYAYFDTMLAHYMSDENDLHDLKYLATKEYNAPNWDIDADEKRGDTPLPKLAKYNAHDTYYANRLRITLTKRLKEDPSTWRLFRSLTMPMSRMFCDAEYHGMYIDEKNLVKAERYWARRRDTAERRLNKIVGRDDVNWASPQQVGQVLFKQLKLKPLGTTKSGQWSTTEGVLLKLAESHQVPRLIIKFRKSSKQLNTFISAWQERHIDGFLHPTMKLHGTVTGRPSCEEPNLYQVPRDPRIRSLFSAPPGWVLVEADHSQVELRFVAHMADERTMKRAFQTGQDIHRQTAEQVFGFTKPTSEQRKRAKSVNFGFVYGMWWRKFIAYAWDKYEMVFTEQEAKRIRKGFFRMFNDLPEWYRKQERFAKRNGYVRSIFGRKRRLPSIHDDNEYIRKEAARQAINSPVQSGASDLTHMAAVEIHETISSDRLRIQVTVYDAIIMLVREKYLDELLPKVKHIMENPKLMKSWKVKFTVPIVAEIKVGPWGKGVEWNG